MYILINFYNIQSNTFLSCGFASFRKTALLPVILSYPTPPVFVPRPGTGILHRSPLYPTFLPSTFQSTSVAIVLTCCFSFSSSPLRLFALNCLLCVSVVFINAKYNSLPKKKQNLIRFPCVFCERSWYYTAEEREPYVRPFLFTPLLRDEGASTRTRLRAHLMEHISFARVAVGDDGLRVCTVPIIILHPPSPPSPCLLPFLPTLLNRALLRALSERQSNYFRPFRPGAVALSFMYSRTVLNVCVCVCESLCMCAGV